MQIGVPLCNKAVSREAVCSFVTPFNAACSFINFEIASRSSTTKNQFSLTRWEVPLRGYASARRVPKTLVWTYSSNP